MSKKTGDYQIPFQDGNQIDYEIYWGKPFEMVDNFVFEDTLTYTNYGKGRSAITFYFTRESNGKEVTMFASNLSEVIPRFVNGKLTGQFTFCKKGQNYGCRMLP